MGNRSFEYLDAFADYERRHSRSIYALAADGEVSVADAELKEPFALMFGNEGRDLARNYSRPARACTSLRPAMWTP